VLGLPLYLTDEHLWHPMRAETMALASSRLSVTPHGPAPVFGIILRWQHFREGSPGALLFFELRGLVICSGAKRFRGHRSPTLQTDITRPSAPRLLATPPR
jgi:hypothetical protein